jgi:hypothetical protein
MILCRYSILIIIPNSKLQNNERDFRSIRSLQISFVDGKIN